MTIITLNLIVILGGFVVGLSGFGFVLVCVPILSLLIDVKLAIVVSALLGWLSSIPIAFKMRQHIMWRPVAILLAGAIPGSILGSLVLREVPSHYILIAMALVIIASSAYCLQLREGVKSESKSGTTVATGLVSGMLGATVGEAGPPIVSYAMIQPWTAAQAKATMLGFFTFQMAAALVSFVFQNLLTFEMITFSAKLLPGLIVGITLGVLCFNFVERRNINFQRYMHCALIAIAVYLLVKSI